MLGNSRWTTEGSYHIHYPFWIKITAYLWKLVWSKSENGCISFPTSQGSKLVRTNWEITKWYHVLQKSYYNWYGKALCSPEIHFLTLIHCRIRCVNNNALQFYITFPAKSSNTYELIWHITNYTDGTPQFPQLSLHSSFNLLINVPISRLKTNMKN